MGDINMDDFPRPLLIQMIGELRSDIVGFKAEIEDLRAERDRLDVVVGRLDKTADGVPVMGGDFVWFKFDDQDDAWRCIVITEAWYGADNGGVTVKTLAVPCSHESMGGLAVYGNTWRVPVERCSSTREAAEAAASAGEGGGA